MYSQGSSNRTVAQLPKPRVRKTGAAMIAQRRADQAARFSKSAPTHLASFKNGHKLSKTNSVFSPLSAVCTPLAKLVTYPAATLDNRESIIAAINEISSRPIKLYHDDDDNPHQFMNMYGPRLTGFDGKESRVISKDELLKFALAEKTVVAQIAAATNPDSPLFRVLSFDLTGNTSIFASSALILQGPTPEECKAARLAEYMSTSIFRLKKLPNEIRHMIYPLMGNMATCHDGSPPPLVQALGDDKFLGPEIMALYKKLNCSVDIENQKEFGQKRLADLNVYENIHMKWGAETKNPLGEHQIEFLQLKAHKIQCMNRFSSITMDFAGHDPSTHLNTFPLLQNIVRASEGVERVAVRLPAPFEIISRVFPRGATHPNAAAIPATPKIDDGFSRMQMMERTQQWLKVPARLATVGPADQMEEWFWAKDFGGELDVQCRGRSQKASAKGRISAQRLIQSRGTAMCDRYRL